MKITIITVCKNSEKFIEKSIQSVISQTYKNIEYIIIDGASTDQTCQIINRYISNINIFISEADESLYEAMNKGITYASGDFLYFLNSDDYIYDQDVIANVVDFISSQPNCEFVYGNCETRSPLGILSIYKPVEPAKILDEMLILGNFPIQAAAFFKATLFKRFGTFSQSYRIAADYEWYTRILHPQDVNIVYYPQLISSFYRGGLSSNFHKVFAEVWQIQDCAPVFQTKYWRFKRIIELQNLIFEADILTNEARLLANKRNHLIKILNFFSSIFRTYAKKDENCH